MTSYDKPRILILSSSESLNIAKNLQTAVHNWSYVEIWSQGLFALSSLTIESLEKKLPQFDCTIIVITPDDKSIVRSKKYLTPRDNIIFEIGLSIGCLGRQNTFMIKPKGSELKIPTDLSGLTIADYDIEAPNIVAELSVVSNQIETIIIDTLKKKFD